ncbi:MAG: hypothetical protein ABMA01_09995 [Chthoniobacteraceae bacterium]
MNDQPDTSPPSPAPAPTPQRSRLLYGCAGMLALGIIIVATVALTLWWVQRPITPVVLSASEKEVVEAKLRSVGGKDAPVDSAQREADRPYTPGSKSLKITERELNGLVNSNTDLGKTVQLELARDAVNAYVTVPIPADFPVGGGKTFRARARFSLSVGNGGAPRAIMEDVTVFGLSLPKDWLAGLKGENLFGSALGDREGSAALRGLKSLRVEPGVLVLELAD